MNQIIKQYLRIYRDYHQDDWSQLLPLAEFIYKNAKNISIGVCLFHANYWYYPWVTLKILPDKKHENLGVETYINNIWQVYKKLQVTLKQAQAKYKKEFAKDRALAPKFQVDNLVWLNLRNIKMTCLSQKLDFECLGPFEIIKVVEKSKAVFELKLLL